MAFSLPWKERVSFNDGAFKDCFVEFITRNILLQSQAESSPPNVVGFDFGGHVGKILDFPSLFRHFDNSKRTFNKHGISDDVNCLQNHKIQAPKQTVWI